jgi:hypothetical protein
MTERGCRCQIRRQSDGETLARVAGRAETALAGWHVAGTGSADGRAGSGITVHPVSVDVGHHFDFPFLAKCAAMIALTSAGMLRKLVFEETASFFLFFGVSRIIRSFSGMSLLVFVL